MSEHRAVVQWHRNGTEFEHKHYTRDHVWHFEGGSSVKASAAPQYFGNEALVDPERAFVAALSSCHMLTFLAVAAKEGLVVEEYRDEAVGRLSRNADKRLAITEVVLRPVVRWQGEPPGRERLDELHAKAHQHCFIANSVATEVKVEY